MITMADGLLVERKTINIICQTLKIKSNKIRYIMLLSLFQIADFPFLSRVDLMLY